MSYTKSNNARALSAAVATRPYTTTRGVELTIHAVPQTIIRAVLPKRPKPEIPFIEMTLPKGGKQVRAAKPGDSAWDKYAIDLADWTKEANDLQEAVTYSMALKSYAFPDTFELSPELMELVKAGLLKLPDNIYQLKMMWARENLITAQDEFEINWLIQELSGVPEDMIKHMKESFRNNVYGKTADAVGDGDAGGSADAENVEADGEVQ